jgi:RHS repeat-associated protein
VTNAKNETTTYGYDGMGYLSSFTGPVSGAVTTFTYDDYGRLRTTTDSDGYTITTDYDAFDRQTQVTYPDSTYEETIYRYLDAEQRRDRLGRWTRYAYDATRRLTSGRDPLGRVVTQEWCTCGSLEGLVDANGSRTRWERDVQGRVTAEVRANGATTQYLYETTTSRLKRFTDAKDQKTNYAYYLDDSVQQITYADAVLATPSVSFTYDSVYGRVATMVDGIGTTTYGYHAVTTPPALGATQLASVDGPLANDTITYVYDELGRVTARAINGSANAVTWVFDALGRATSEVNALGTFTYTYDGPPTRVATVTYPNSQTSAYSYYGNAVDRRLQTIHHKYPNGTTLSKFDYTYDVAGNILTWRQQADSTAVLWEYGYDATDQLVTAVKKSTDPTPAILRRYGYAYDPAGNRLVEQIDDQVTGASYNNMNELVSQQPAGLLRFEGTVSEPSTVTIGGKPAIVSPTNEFKGAVPITAGPNTVTITATDANGNSGTKTYLIDGTGATKTYTYDANGNLTSDGVRTFGWDARNQLVSVTMGTHRSELKYDGRQRLTRLVEVENEVPESDTYSLWCDSRICEKWSASTGLVTWRLLAGGEMTDAPHYFATDHLRNVTSATDIGGTLLTRYSYDPWGRREAEVGAVGAVGFSGLSWHDVSGTWLGMLRAYSPDMGRWIAEDPIGELSPDGPNMYEYVTNRPLTLVDPLGLSGLPGPLTSLPPEPPVPPGCTKIGVMIFCKPDPTPRMCPAHPRRCTPFFDRVAYWACVVVRLTSPSFFYPSPGGSTGSAVSVAVACTQDATFCLEGGTPPAPPGPPDPQVWFRTTRTRR